MEKSAIQNPHSAIEMAGERERKIASTNKRQGVCCKQKTGI
jgi:hypothetical protein